MSLSVPLEGFGGGGGASLNFNIKAYATEEARIAATPSENTIGIITDTPINGYCIGNEEPNPAAAGMLWITVDTSSKYAFNALKKNSLTVYPMTAKQYIGGAWVEKDASTYQDGEWNDWIQDLYLFNNGDQCVDVTGGWIGVSNYGTINIGSTNIAITAGNADATVYTVNKLDLSKYNTMVVVCNTTKTHYLTVGISSVNTTDYASQVIASTQITDDDNGDHVLTVDISNVDGGYPFIFSNETNGTITEVILMK